MSDEVQHTSPQGSAEEGQTGPVTLESLEDWDRLPLHAKKTIIDAVIIHNRTDVEKYIGFLHERDWNSYMLEWSYITGMVSLAETEENLTAAIVRIAAMEETLAVVMPGVMRSKAESLVAGLEKGLVFAPGIIPPEQVAEVMEKFDAVRNRLNLASGRQDYEQVLEEIAQIQDMLKPRI